MGIVEIIRKTDQQNKFMADWVNNLIILVAYYVNRDSSHAGRVSRGKPMNYVHVMSEKKRSFITKKLKFKFTTEPGMKSN